MAAVTTLFPVLFMLIPRFPQHILTKQAVYLGRRPYSP